MPLLLSSGDWTGRWKTRLRYPPMNTYDKFVAKILLTGLVVWALCGLAVWLLKPGGYLSLFTK